MLLVLLAFQQLKAQSPEKFNYQAVVRDASGNVLANQSVSFRMSILQSSVDGAAVYVETHTTTSNAHGQVSLSIGSGTPVSGTFTGISWVGSSHFLKTEMDASGGTSYVLMGTTQLLSVPYALYAKEAGSGGTTYTAGAGIDITGTTITNTQPNATHTGDATGSDVLTVVKLQGRNVSDNNPMHGEVLKWNNNNGTWEPSYDAATVYSPGTGIWINSNIISNTLPNATHTGDAVGSSGLTVVRIMGRDIALTAPENGQALKWNSTSMKWEPATDNNTTYSSGSGILINGTTISNIAPDQTVSITSANGIAVNGTYPNFTITNTKPNEMHTGDATGSTNLTVSRIQGRSVAPVAPYDGQALKWSSTASSWIPANDENTTYNSGTGININGTIISNTAPDQYVNISGGTGISISGAYPNFTILNTQPNAIHTGDAQGDSNLTVVKIQGKDVSDQPPLHNQVLKWDGVDFRWEPGNDNNTTYTGGTGITVTGTSINNTQPNATHTGDATGSAALTVVKIQGRDVATTEPSNGQALKWNNSSLKWEPANDNNTTYTSGTGIEINGTTIYNSQPNATHTGDVIGSNYLTVVKIQGRDVSNTSPNPGQLLKWNNSNSTWEPQYDENTTYTGGSGIEINGTTINNTAPDQTVSIFSGSGISATGTYPYFTISNTQPNAMHSGDATGSSDLTVVKIQGRSVASTSPEAGEVLKWNNINNRWEPTTDENTTYSGGSGISILGTTISNTAPDQTISIAPGTGISTSGTYPNFTVSNTQPNVTHTGDAIGSDELTVVKVQGRSVASNAPTNGQVIKWNSSAQHWEPAGDNNNIYTGGTGINVTGNTIENTAPDQIVSLSGSGSTSISGAYPNFTISSTDENTTYAGGSGISIAGSTISNTAPDQTVSIASGTGISTSGTYPDFTVTNTLPNATHTGDATGDGALTVVRIQGRDLANTIPANGQALKWNSVASKWEPATDENTTYSAGSGVNIDGTTIVNTAPDQTVSIASGTGISASGTYPDFTITNTQPNATHTGDATGNDVLTVVKLQGRELSDAAPASGQVIKWNGSAWAPSNETDPAMPSGTGYATIYHNGINWVTSSLLYNTNQRIGIGTSNPNQQLEITGNFRLPASSATVGNFYKGSNVFIHNKGTDNIYVDENSGNLNATAANNTALGAYSLYNVTTGHSQTAIGSSALRNTTSGQQNTAIGYWAMYSNTTGSFNTALGYRAISANTSGTENVALGYQTLMSNSTGNANTAVGYQALINNSTGYQNTGIGDWALKSNTIGAANTAVGYYSLNANTTGEFNTSFGTASMYSNKANSRSTAVGYNAMYFADDRTTGRETYNTALGYEALKGSSTPSNNTGQYNTAVGDRANSSNTSGSKNAALGHKALFSTTSGWENIAIGYGTLYGNIANSRNTAVGHEALYNFNSTTNTATNNVAIGYRAGYGVDGSTGVNNIFIGSQAGDNVSTGSNNIVLGHNIDLTSADANNQMIIGNSATLYGDLANNRIGIGTTEPTQKLDIDGQIRIRGGNPGQNKVLTSDANGIGTWQDVAEAIAPGTTPGQMLYWDGSSWTNIEPGFTGQVLVLLNGVPTWGSKEMATGADDVYNPQTGRIWFNRNHGAPRVAQSSTDYLSFGYLYQWGRGTDGHQVRDNWDDTTSVKSETDTPGHGHFILSPDEPFDWRSPQNSNLWQGVSGINNPCPSGYRLPTIEEWNQELSTWSSNDHIGAFNSVLKLPMAGDRGFSTGTPIGPPYWFSKYWSSSTTGTSVMVLHFVTAPGMPPSVQIMTTGRACGASVRCIKN